MNKKLIEKICIFSAAAGVLAALIVVPVSSYASYLKYLEENVVEVEPPTKTPKPVLESIDAVLNEGVQYYANDIAEARPEHFTVTANYTLEGSEPYTEIVETDKFDVSTPSDFYANGGDVTISYRGKTDVVKIELIPVQLQEIEIVVTPYTISYAAGSFFNADGMIVNAIYNDGSEKTLSDEDYIVDTETALTISDESVVVSYTDGEITKTAEVAIKVSQSLDNGDITNIMIAGDAIVNAGDVLSNTLMEVNAVYESGNRILLSNDQYTINGVEGTVEYGRKYSVEVVYNDDNSKKVNSDVVVRQKIEGESGEIVGGSIKTETEYKVIDGVITETENDVTFAGNFSNAVTGGNEGSLTLTVESATETVSDITMRCSNSYNVYANGSSSSGGYMMKPLQINTILDLNINGREVSVPSTVILKGCGPYETYAPLYGIYYEFTFEDIALDAGPNAVKFDFKRSTVGATNCWGESPSTLNIDYVNFDTIGNDIPENAKVTAIAISDSFVPEYADSKADLVVPVIGTLENGTRIMLPSDAVNVTISGGVEGEEYFGFGEYTITATLKDDATITASKTVTIEEFYSFVILTADIIVENDKVYYTFTGRSVGYVAEDLEFFSDDTTYFEHEWDCEYTFTPTTFELKINVTDFAVGTSVNPHMRVKGENYVNGANSNGDIRGNGLTFEDGKSVVHNNKKYTIVTTWSMPSLFIEEPDAATSEATSADIVLENDRVYWIFEFDNVGYTAYEIFDGETIYASETTFPTSTTAVVKIDVTDVAAGTQIYPHARVTDPEGNVVMHPGHNNGDLLVDEGNYDATKTVTYGEKTYQLVAAWGMPTLVVSAA